MLKKLSLLLGIRPRSKRTVRRDRSLCVESLEERALLAATGSALVGYNTQLEADVAALVQNLAPENNPTGDNTDSAITAIKLNVTGPSSTVEAGVASSFTVTALDSLGNVATWYRGTIHFGSIDSQAALPDDYTFTAADLGTHTFTATLKTAVDPLYVLMRCSCATCSCTLRTNGYPSLIAADLSQSTIAGRVAVTVEASALNGLRVATLPTPFEAGGFANFSLTAVDAFGNTVTGYRGTVHFSANNQSEVPGDFNADSIVDAEDYVLWRKGLSTTDGQNDYVAWRSQFVNSRSSNVSLPADYTFTAGDDGARIFNPTFDTPGTWSLIATDSETNSITASNTMVVVAPASGAGESAAASAASSVHFAAIGDFGDDNDAEADVAALVKSWNPDFVITVGDNNYETGSASTIDANIGKYYHDYIYQYVGNFGSGSPTMRFYPTLGNHDWGNDFPKPNGANPYLNYFTLPGNERYYTFTQGPVQFFALDTDLNEPDGISATSTQAMWLQSQLAASTATYKIVYFHHPPYSSNSDSETEDMRWPFQEWGATAVISGHAHVYERLIEDNNFPYFIDGLGGRDNIHDFDDIEFGSKVRYNDDFGAMLVDADLSELRLQFITRTGALIDTYSIPSPLPRTTTTFVPAGANWKYLDNGTNQGTAWRAPAFNDSAWASGPAQLGYGEGDEQTVVGFGSSSSNRYITTYFRESFVVSDPSAAADGLELKLLRDDGAVVYLNGTEVFRSNMPTSTIGFQTLASTAVGGTDESTFYVATINPSLLVAGTNVLAVELHQSAANSSDLSFDLSLTGTRLLGEGTLSNLQLAGFPSSTQAGATGSFTVIASDAFGNTVTGYRGTIHFTSSDPTAVLPADYTFTAADNGTHTFIATLKTVGTQSLVATDTVTNTVAGNQSVTVQAAAASQLLVAGFPSPIQVGVAKNFTVTALDAYGNTATGYRGRIHFSSSDPLATLPADYTFTAADNGTHTFSATFRTTGTQTLVATDTVTGSITGAQTITTPQVTTLVAAGSVWKYLDNGTNQGTAWRTTAFNDSTWSSGTAKLGYGDGDEQTVVGFGSASNRYITTYFRKPIVVADPSVAADGLTLNLLRDDGAVVYLNGTEVFRTNMPTGTIGYQTVANVSMNDADESTFLSATINPALLVAGTNVLAVEIHQWDSSSTDISFDLSLVGSRTATSGVVSSLRLASFPSPSQAGEAGNFAVTAVDGLGATVAGYRGTIHFTSSDPQAVLPADYTFTAADNGTHTFSATLKTSGTQSIVATDTATGAIAGSQSVTVQANAASILRVAGFPSSIATGVAGNFTITAQDAYGNTATGYRGTIHFTSSDPQAVLPADYTFTAADNGTHTFSATLKTFGSQSIVATDTVTNTVTGSQTVTVQETAASVLRVASFPSPVQAGVAGNFTVTAQDANGNTLTGYRGTIHFTSSDPQAVLPADYTFTAADNGTHTFSATVKTAGTQSLVATDTVAIAGSQSVTVQANAASILRLAGFPSSIQTNVAGNMTITALDAFGNTATGYRGTIHFTSSDSQAVLPADYTFTAADNGARTFSATLKTPGSQSIVATDTVTNTVTGSQTVTVQSVPVSTILIAAGSVWKYLDNGTNQGTAWRATSFSDATWPSGTAQLGYGDGDEQTVVGFGSASNRYITTYFRKSFVISDPSVAANGLTLNLLRDDGAVVYLNGTEVLRSNMPTGTIGYQTVANVSMNDADESTFSSFTINPAILVAGTNVLAVEIHQWDASSTDISFDLSLTGTGTSTPGVVSSLRLASFPSPSQAGVAGNFTVTAVDGLGATVTGYRGTIHFASSDPQAVLPADYTFTAADNGTHTFSATLKTSGTQSLVATDTVTGAIAGSQSVTVQANAASVLRVGGFPSSIATGVAGNFTITALDAFGNTATGYRGTIHFTSSDPTAVLPADYTFTASDNGTHTFSATLKTFGSQSIVATDTVTNTVTGSQTVTVQSVPINTTLVAAGSVWKYLDNGTNQGTAWKATAFNDATWSSGAAQLGYGDGDEQTVVGFGSASNRYITTYFRKSFVVADPSVGANGLTLNLLRDDGAVVYLNGTEVLRSNMPTGTIGYQTVANVSMNNADESTFSSFTINPALLVAGTNVLAVEIHQWDSSSTDISFDLSLVGTGTAVSGTSGGNTLAMSSISPQNQSLRGPEIAANLNDGLPPVSAHVSNVLNTTRFAVIGDYGASDTTEADVAALIKSWNPDLILTVGDNNFPDGSASTIDENIGQYYHDFIYPYLGNYGAGATTNRFYPTLGNRDWGDDFPNPDGAQAYLEYFTLPGNERYYTFTAGPVQFFALDSDNNEPDGILATSPQANWLQTQLAASTATYKIVYFHHPPYSSTSWSETTEVRWPFQEWGATAVLTAHAHNYERLIEDNNFPYFVNGLSGSDALDPFDEIEAGSQVRYNGDYGALFITVDATQMQFQFITRTGVVIDSYTIPAPLPQVHTTLVPAGAAWKYLDNGSNQATAWRDIAFNDSAWSSGPAQLGYGDGDEQTVVGYGSSSSNKYVTTYFRQSFVVSNPSVAADRLTLNLLRDDGAVVYLNGTELFRSNMPTGTIGYRSFASSQVNGSDELAWYSISIDPSLLVAGTNVLAVEIHQRNTSNADISFDLSLIGMRVQSPGDFNIDGFVDAADYVAWRKGLGTTHTQANYDIWRPHFGDTAGGGSDNLTTPDAGAHAFSASLQTSDNQSLTLFDNVTNSMTGTQRINTQLATANSMRVSGFASPTRAGVAKSYIVSARDAYGDTVTDYRDTICYNTSDGRAVSPPNYSFTATDSGVHTFDARLKKKATQLKKVIDTVNSSINGLQSDRVI